MDITFNEVVAFGIVLSVINLVRILLLNQILTGNINQTITVVINPIQVTLPMLLMSAVFFGLLYFTSKMILIKLKVI